MLAPPGRLQQPIAHSNQIADGARFRYHRSKARVSLTIVRGVNLPFGEAPGKRQVQIIEPAIDAFQPPSRLLTTGRRLMIMLGFNKVIGFRSTSRISR